jgi:hypothetical protein
MKGKIAVVTKSHADRGYLYWPVRDLFAHSEVDLKVFALVSPLSSEFGSAIQKPSGDDRMTELRHMFIGCTSEKLQVTPLSIRICAPKNLESAHSASHSAGR